MNQTDNSFWERATRIPTQDTLADPDIISQMDMPTYEARRSDLIPDSGSSEYRSKGVIKQTAGG